MNSEILEEAIVRLDRAVARAEAAATRRAERSVTPDPAPPSDLAERHERLRDRTKAALARLDAVLPPESE